MKKQLIGIAGPTASGKTSAAAFIEAKYWAVRFRYSQIISKFAAERGLPHDKATLQNLSTELRGTHGEDFLTKHMEHRVEESPEKVVVIEGNRRMGDMYTLSRLSEKTGRTLTLLYIDASQEVRFERINTRLAKEGNTKLSLEAFTRLENDECEEELPLVCEYIKKHGLIISNSTITEEMLGAQIDTLLERTLK
jgi:dephospho-CoA kinase